MKKTLLQISSLFVCQMVFADTPPNGDIDLNGGSIAGDQPKPLAISLTSLFPGVLYQVTCTIDNPNYKTNSAMITASFSNPAHTSNPTFSLNTKTFTNAIALSTTQEGNAFVASNIANYTATPAITLNIGNIDTDKTSALRVSDCIAVPMMEMH